MYNPGDEVIIMMAGGGPGIIKNQRIIFGMPSFEVEQSCKNGRKIINTCTAGLLISKDQFKQKYGETWDEMRSKWNNSDILKNINHYVKG